VVKTVVVTDTGEERAVGVEGDGRERTAIFEKAADEFGGEMLGLGCAASVAADEEFISGVEGFHDQRAGAVDLGANVL